MRGKRRRGPGVPGVSPQPKPDSTDWTRSAPGGIPKLVACSLMKFNFDFMFGSLKDFRRAAPGSVGVTQCQALWGSGSPLLCPG